MEVKTKTYESGLRLIVANMPDSRAVSTFFGINTGSVNENENNKKLVDTFNNLLDAVDLTEHTYGNMGNNLDKMIKYRDNVWNLEQMIINECRDLFMLLYI